MESRPRLLKSRLFSWALSKYASREVLYSFFMGTLIFLAIMLLFQAIRLSEWVINYQVSGWNVLKLTYFMGLSFVGLAVPIAFLFSVLLGISRANSEGEILALQVGGISLGQIYRPIFFVSIFLTLFCLAASMVWVPRGNRGFELLFTRISSEKIMQRIKPGVFIQSFYGLVLFVEKITPVRNELRRVFIYDERDPDHPLAVTAQAGLIRTNFEKGLITLRLSDGSVYVEKRTAGGVQQKINFDVYDINLDFDRGGNEWRASSVPSLDYWQLAARIEKSRDDPRAVRQLQVEFHRRVSLAFACLVFGAMGFFIGTLSVRGLRSSSIVICLLVATIYWLSYVMASALASEGWVWPWLGIWLPNILFLFVPIYCYRRYYR